ncbi:MAG TPA: hypothetical protein PK239_16585 [Chitinophagales bacterium]|nr:hypothetical protein [Chitinophagales bacterium]HRK28892.1 hypothetical protein [Chitinophagales bacterium]
MKTPLYYYIFLLLLLGCIYPRTTIFAADITWQGGISNNWNTAANWVGGNIPGAADRVFIPQVSGTQVYPVVSAAVASVRYVEALNNAQITIASGGNLTINGTGCSGSTCYGLYLRNNATCTINAGGALAVQNTGSYGIYSNKGHFVNNGAVSVTNIADRGLFITTNGTSGYNPTFTNTGNLSLSNISSTGIYTNIENDTLLFNNTGSLSLSNIGASGMYHYSYRTNSRIVFTNNGSINIFLCANRGIVNECRPDVNTGAAYFVFDNYGSITIDSTGQHGIYHYNNKGTFYFYNRSGAQITVRKVGNNANLYQRGIYNHNRQDDLSFNPYFEAHNWGTITVRQTNSQGIRNESMKHELRFTNHHMIRTARTADSGVMNYCNNTFSKVIFNNAPSGNIYIDTVSVYGLYNTVALNQTADTTAILTFSNDGLIKIDSTTSHAVYNNTDNGQLSFTNNGNLTVRRAGSRGIFNRQNKLAGNFACGFLFSNFGVIDIDFAQQQGIYHYSNRHLMECVNFNNIIVKRVNQSDGLRCTAENNGQVTHTNYGNINIQQINRQGIYISTATGGAVTFNNQSALNITQCSINGLNIYALNGTVSFTNAATLNISNITADGVYNEAVKNNNAYPTQVTFTHQAGATLNISNCADDGWTALSNNAIHTVHFSGAVNLFNASDIGLINSTTNNGLLTMNVNAPMDIYNCTNQGLYNITDNGAAITFNNYANIEIENTGKAGIYNQSRDGLVNFNNYLFISTANTLTEAGIYNYNRQEEAPYPAALQFNNPGQIWITGCNNHGLIFNNANGAITAQNGGNITITNVGQQGLYCYNRASNESFPLSLNFTNSGAIQIDSALERGIYNYTYRGQPLTFTNNGNIDISSTRWRGIFNFSENNLAILNFINNGSIAIDSAREEGIYNQVTQTNPAQTAQLHFTNNGSIAIDSTKLDGLQNFGNRGNLTFTNTANGSINITRTREYGIINQNREDQAAYNTAMNFTNNGSISITDALFAGWYNFNERGNALAVQNNGTVNIAQCAQYGMYNRCFNSTPNPPDYNYEITNLNFANAGTLNITNTTQAGIYNYADAGDNVNFTNNGNLTISNTAEQGIYNRSRKSGTFTPVVTFQNNGGTVSVANTALSSVYNYANNDSLYFYNNAALNLQASGAHGIYNYVENNTSVIQFQNQVNGNIHIQNTTQHGIYNHTTRSASTQTNALQFTNSGGITIGNLQGRGIYNYDYRCNFFTFTNAATGSITLQNLSQHALYNETATTSAAYPMSNLVFNNQGSVLIQNLLADAQAIYNNNTNSLLQFANSGSINVQNIPGANGIISQSTYTNATDYAATALTFNTSGSINIRNTGEEGLKNINYGGAYSFTNTGNISITATGREGIENAGYANVFTFANSGNISLFQNTFDSFYNTNASATALQCTNQACGLLRTDGRIKNNANCTLTNAGIIETTYGFNHSNQGSFINNGIIESSGSFNTTPVALQNNATILPYIVTQPINVCGYQPVSPALYNFGGVYSVGGWFTAPTGTQSAGTYNSATNTFTPLASLPFGEQTLYVQTTDNITGCNRRRPITVTVYALPVVNPQPDTQICAGDPLPTLAITDSLPNMLYYWYPDAVGGVPLHSGAAFTPPVNAETAGAYTWHIEAQMLTGGCLSNARTPITLTVLPLPDLPIPANNTYTINEGDPVPPLTIQNTLPNVQYLWFTQLTGGTPVFTGNAYTPAPPAAYGAFVWYVEAQNTQTGCTTRSRTPVTLVIIDLPYTPFKAKVLLQGAYNPATDLMTTQLQTGNLLPYFQPFYEAPWLYDGSVEDVLNTNNIPPNTTDWVLIEARSANNPDMIMEQRAVFLRNDGALIDMDGTEGVQFFDLSPNTAYYFIVRSRNHLAVVSNTPVQIPNTAPYNFTNPANIMGGQAQVAAVGSGIFALAAGDMNADGIISVADFNRYAQQAALTNQYRPADLNLDKNVTTADFNILQPNMSRIGLPMVRY